MSRIAQLAQIASVMAITVVSAVTWNAMSSRPSAANFIIPTSKADCDAIRAQYLAESRVLADQADALIAQAKGHRGLSREWHRLYDEAGSLRTEVFSKITEAGRAFSRCMSALARAKQLNEGLEDLTAGKAIKATKDRYIKSSNAALGASAIWDSPEILGLLSGKGTGQDKYSILSKYGTVLASKYIDFATNNRLTPGRDNWIGSAVFSAAMAEIRQRHLQTLAELERIANEIANFQGTPDTLDTTAPLMGSPDPATLGAPDSEAALEGEELFESLIAEKKDRDVETIRERRRSTLDRLVAAKRDRDRATLEQREREARVAEERRQQAARAEQQRRQAAQQARSAKQQRQPASLQASDGPKQRKTCYFEGGGNGLKRLCSAQYLNCLKAGGQAVDSYGYPREGNLSSYEGSVAICKDRASDLGMRPSDF